MPSCGPFEGLNRSPPSSQPSCPAPAHRPAPPGPRLGLVRLLLLRGINAVTLPAPTRRAPPLLPHPCAAVEEQRGPSEQSSIFSGNLVQKLRRLGLHRVVARGERSYAVGERREQRDAPT